MRKFFAHPVHGRADERTYVRSLISAADETKVTTTWIPGSSKFWEPEQCTPATESETKRERRNYTQYFIIYLFYIRWLNFLLIARSHRLASSETFSIHVCCWCCFFSRRSWFYFRFAEQYAKSARQKHENSHISNETEAAWTVRCGVNAQKARKFTRNIWTRHCPRSLAIKCRKTVKFHDQPTQTGSNAPSASRETDKHIIY